ncbi:MAG TPA: energy-coupling factor transporter transmembrane component T [Solirubrobacteraceae bacterium]|jgi:energy-coupling factor transport system permease protein|nr:energy-coupling factor transporter transmembrane component T [Solirubrobacteraceae bacterium]
MNAAVRSSRVLAYRRRPTPLHAARATVAAAYGVVLASAALILESPVLLGSLLVTVLAAAYAAGVGRQILTAVRVTVVPVVLLTVIVNVAVSRGGLTVFARLGDWGVLGQMNLTVESVVYGLVMALRLIVATLACLLVVCAADPDALLFACRRISPHSALTAALATRLLPVLAADASRLSEAQRCRPDGGARGTRGRLAVLRATVSGAFDRSLDVAAVLEMRGYGARGRGRGRPSATPRSRHDLAFALATLCLLALAALTAAADLAPFHTYPLVGITIAPATLVVAVALPLLALVPFLDRRGIEL